MNQVTVLSHSPDGVNNAIAPQGDAPEAFQALEKAERLGHRLIERRNSVPITDIDGLTGIVILQRAVTVLVGLLSGGRSGVGVGHPADQRGASLLGLPRRVDPAGVSGRPAGNKKRGYRMMREAGLTVKQSGCGRPGCRGQSWRQAAFVAQLIKWQNGYRSVRITYYLRPEGGGPGTWYFGGQYSPSMSLDEFRSLMTKLQTKGW